MTPQERAKLLTDCIEQAIREAINDDRAIRTADELYKASYEAGRKFEHEHLMDEFKLTLLAKEEEFKDKRAAEFEKGRKAGMEEAAKVARLHETLNPSKQYAEGYYRAVSEIVANIRALKSDGGKK